MRIIRQAAALIVALMLAVGALSMVAGPAQAKESRVVTEPDPSDRGVAYNAVQLKGKAEELGPDGVTLVPSVGVKVFVQKKACPKCKWKTVKKIKTNSVGVYKTRIFLPPKGRWKWRSYMKADERFATYKGKAWTLYYN